MKLVVGMRRNELIEPTELPEDFIEKVYNRILDFRIPPKQIFGTTKDVLESRILEEADEWIEIFGVWEDRCVLTTAQNAIRKGISVMIPKGYTFRNPNSGRNSLKEDVNFIYNFTGIDPFHTAGLKTCQYTENNEYVFLKSMDKIPEPYL